MAKKKRKHFIKLNNKIKSLFGNEPFDKAVESFDDNTLYGLLMLLGEDIGSLERIDIIKYLRRVWSEGNYTIRKAIVEFLEDEFKDKKQQINDKVDLILSFLKDEKPTPQEEELILSDFIDKKMAKISKNKVVNKLFYLRKLKILNRYSKLLNIDFSGDNTIEFSQEFKVELEKFDTKINLICTIKLEELTTTQLIEKDKEFVLNYITGLKVKAIEAKETELKEFLDATRQIEYLNDELIYDIFSLLKEPIRDLYHIPIPLKLVKKILGTILKDIDINATKRSYIISKEYNYKIFEHTLEYLVKVIYESKTLYSSIWTNRAVEIAADLASANQNNIAHFELFIEGFRIRVKEALHPLELSEDEINKYIVSFLEPYIKSSRSLELKSKLIKRALYHLSEKFKEQKEQKKRELLLAKTIRDFKKLFPVARSLNREIVFNVGPTNSGKTYNALQELKDAQSGLYLAPLRLLAQEGYEDLKNSGVNVSLITGEEEIIDDESTHISSTIEMLNSDIEVDICVIDEIQMIGDRDRGWAWANALIGAPAKKVILTGSSDALGVVREIAKYLQEDLKVVEFKRKNELKLLDSPTPIGKLEESTAIVAFSRKEVLALKSKVSSFYKTSVVYGNLSPEVRREEARRFREGESQILIATDAIAMGLNLPIKSILFARDNKFDGLQRRELTTSEVLQIAGRAGRFGLHESGYVGALDSPTLSTIKEKFNGKLKPLKLPISVMASLEHVLLIGEILQTTNLYTILEFFATNMEFDGPFVAANIDSMIEVAKIVDEYRLDLVSKYHLACAPVSINSPHIQRAFHRYLRLLEEDKEVSFLEPTINSKKTLNYSSLLNAEDIVKEVSLYLWLSFKFSDKFKDTQIAKQTRDKFNSYIEKSLKETNFTKECNKCGKELDLSYKFSICDSCYSRAKRGYRREKVKKDRKRDKR